MKTEKSEENSALKSTFVKAVSVLVGGTALAHGLTALALPVLSRIYSPADFSMLAVFTSLLSMVAVAACLRFDVAIAIPDKDIDAANLLALSIVSALLITLIVAIPILLFSEQIANILNQAKLAPFLWLLPLGILLAASYSAVQTWLVRKKEFGQIARSRVVQSSIASGIQISMGTTGFGTFGLLLGYVLNAGAACIVMGYRIIKFDYQILRQITWPGMRAMALQYHRYPKYSTWEALSNNAAIQVPIIIIAALAIGPEAGYLSMAMYVMQAPMALIGGAISQVYLSRAPEEHRSGKLDIFTIDVLKGLLKAGVGPLLFVGIVSPVVFPFIFGESWQRAGDLVAWMTPWFIMQFLSSPISMALHVIGHQHTAMSLQNFSLIFRVIVVYYTAKSFPVFIAESYALSGFFVYSLYTIIVLKNINIKYTQFLIILAQSSRIILLWMLLAFTTLFVFKYIHN